MKNGELLRNMTDQELAEYLCEKLDCTRCPAEEKCRDFVTGLVEWLKKDVED